MAAKPAMATTVHRCSKCGESDLSKFYKNRNRKNGLQSWCKRCNNDNSKDYMKFTQGLPTANEHPRSTIKFVTLVCANCEKEFRISEFQKRRRLKQKVTIATKNGTVSDDKLYCGKSCSRSSGHKVNVKTGRKLKKRAWKSDDQNYWDQVLHDAGLGEWRGYGREFLVYGLHNYVEGIGSDGKIRITAKRRKGMWDDAT